MICLDNTDVIEGGAATDAVVDYTIHGLVSETFTQLAAGVLSDTLTAVLYTAGAAVAVVSIVLVNTHSAAVAVTLRLDPANGGSPRYLIPETISLGAGYSLHTDGARISVLNASGEVTYTYVAHTHDAETLQLDAITSDGGAFSFTTSGTLTFSNTTALTTCASAGADVNKFLVLDAGNNIDYRTGANVLADLSGDAGAAFSWNGQNLSSVGTIGCGAITTTAGFTFSGANPDIIGGDTDGALSITADTATNQGGSIKLYGNTHATLAQDIEFYADATKVLEWDESEGNWDFNTQNVKGIGTLACGAITVADGSSISLQEDITFTGATTENLIKMPDHLADALSIQEATNKYITFVTTNSSEAINIFKETFVSDHGTAATDMLVNVCYGTGAAPAANTTTIGALYIKYVA